MTSPTLFDQPVPRDARREQGAVARIGIPLLLFMVTMLSTTAVGMRYMHNFREGTAPLASDTDILPFLWVWQHLGLLATGLPFSLTLVGILLTHEFGHYFACRSFGVKSTLPYMLPAPSLSGTFGAVIRLQSAIRSRAALICIGAAGPIAGFTVAVGTVLLGLAWSTYSGTSPLAHKVQPPLAIVALQHLVAHLPGGSGQPLANIVPHPVLIASWIGLLITALNLIPAGQLDGGHILYAISPRLHRWSSRLVVIGLLILGFFFWAGWTVWGLVLMTPAMRHPKVKDESPLTGWQVALAPVCLLLLAFCGTFAPFHGFGLIHLVEKFVSHGQ